MVKFEEVYNDLKSFLSAKHFSIDSPIMGYVALTLAGANVKRRCPFEATFGPNYLEITNISEHESQMLKGYLEKTLQSEVICLPGYINKMENPFDYPSFYFAFSLEKFATAFIPRFKEYVNCFGDGELFYLYARKPSLVLAQQPLLPASTSYGFFKPTCAKIAAWFKCYEEPKLTK